MSDPLVSSVRRHTIDCGNTGALRNETIHQRARSLLARVVIAMSLDSVRTHRRAHTRLPERDRLREAYTMSILVITFDPKIIMPQRSEDIIRDKEPDSKIATWGQV